MKEDWYGITLVSDVEAHVTFIGEQSLPREEVIKYEILGTQKSCEKIMLERHPGVMLKDIDDAQGG